jgi:5-formyltetrahydrofolate cyclo-ligase
MRELSEQKRAARSAAQAVRAQASLEDAGASRRAAAHVLAAVAPLHAVRTVAGYLPIRNELDPRPAMLALLGLGYRVAVPEVVRPRNPLVFRAWSPETRMEPGRYGIPVPIGAEAVHPDLVLVPMLAFDRRGHRLGYGGGFYDRTIAALRASGPIVVLGFAHAAQEVETVPDSEHDMPLDAIVTEDGLILPTA